MTKITIDRAAVEQALDALDGTEALLTSMDVTHLLLYVEVDNAITALRAALADLERLVQEPDPWGAGYEAGYAAGMAEHPAERRRLQPRDGAGSAQLHGVHGVRLGTELALVACSAGPDVDPIFAVETEDALRAALAEPVQEPVQEPVAWMYPDDYEKRLLEDFCKKYGIEDAENKIKEFML